MSYQPMYKLRKIFVECNFFNDIDLIYAMYLDPCLQAHCFYSGKGLSVTLTVVVYDTKDEQDDKMKFTTDFYTCACTRY